MHSGLRTEFDWKPYLDRYQGGEWRAPIFHDMVMADVAALTATAAPVLLDIGCGRGFDDDLRLQTSLALKSSRYIGVEPDPDIALAAAISEPFRCAFEEAPIPPGSVDCAFAVMVLEHVTDPAAFWRKTADVLRPGGIFWGFTVDSRHWFSSASRLMKSTGLKDWYLNQLHGRKGVERYENYPIAYKTNTPKQVEAFTSEFSACDIVNFQRVGQMDFYLPRFTRWVGRLHDQFSMAMGRPGNVLLIRAVK